MHTPTPHLNRALRAADRAHGATLSASTLLASQKGRGRNAQRRIEAAARIELHRAIASCAEALVMLDGVDAAS